MRSFSVTSGYRWVLTYNLALDPAQPRPSASLLDQVNTQPLQRALNRWLAERPSARKNKYLYHVLDHDYTEASICLNGLKAQDLVRVQALEEECGKLPVDVYLALLEKVESGSVEGYHGGYRKKSYYGRNRYYDDGYYDDEDEGGYHEISEVLQSNHKVLTLVDLDGHTAAKDLQLEEEDILQEDAFEDIQGREHYEGYMGNWVCPLYRLDLGMLTHSPGTNSHTLVSCCGMISLCHYYSGPTNPRNQAVVIVPHESLVGLFTSSGQTPSPVTHLARRCMLPQAQPSLFTALEAGAWPLGMGERVVECRRFQPTLQCHPEGASSLAFRILLGTQPANKSQA